MNRFLLLAFMLIAPGACVAQSLNKTIYSDAVRIVHLSSVADTFQFDRLRTHKHDLAVNKNNRSQRTSGGVPIKRHEQEPYVRAKYTAHEFGGNPNDNSLAISNDRVILAIQNKYVYAFEEDGTVLFVKSLRAFIGTSETAVFDPRVLFDPQERKFVITMLSGKTYQESKLYLCFSHTADPSGSWNVMSLSGNPLGDNTWTDFPVFSLTPSEIIVTSNSFFNGSVNNSGFKQSLVWRISKRNGFLGLPLTASVYPATTAEGKNVFNLTPASEWFSSESEIILLSNEALTGGDKFHVVTIEDNGLVIQTVTADISYSLPANATQPLTSVTLNTNDCRILDATYLDGKWYFVLNTTYEDHAAIYLGTVSQSSNGFQINGRVIADENHIAFPSLAALEWNGQRSLMIGYLHSSSTNYPGSSIVQVDVTSSDLVASQPLKINEGDDYFGVWGDYTDIKKVPGTNEVVYCGSFGLSSGTIGGGESATVIAFARPAVITDAEHPVTTEISLFPNPTIGIFYVEIGSITRGDVMIEIYDRNGLVVGKPITNRVSVNGRYRFTVNTTGLPPGVFQVRLLQAGRVLLNEKLVVIN
ncbi:MAG TPA: T9SS type A sorting domain-containing protein [Chryseosolibacter sp.]